MQKIKIIKLIFHKDNQLNIYLTSFLKNYKILAEKAIIELNGDLFLPKASKTGVAKPIHVCKFDTKPDKNNLSNKNLIVKYLDLSVTTKDFYKIFAEFGEIASCKLEYDQDGKSKGYGYVSYVDPECANKAIEKLNLKEINGKAIEIAVLIPSKNKCCIYVKNFPRDFTDEDLKKFFSKFGEITSVVISKNPKGSSKGFGFITFANFQEANNTIKHTNEEHFTFPGCAPLFASLPLKKEDRQYLYGRTDDPNRHPKIFARLIDINGVVNNLINFFFFNFSKVFFTQEFF